MKTILNLTTPVGRIAINERDIIAISEHNRHSNVKAQIWLRGMEEACNICEEYDEVIGLLAVNQTK
jgi:hypothetical protein